MANKNEGYSITYVKSDGHLTTDLKDAFMINILGEGTSGSVEPGEFSRLPNKIPLEGIDVKNLEAVGLAPDAMP